jgi:hypothetical protein
MSPGSLRFCGGARSEVNVSGPDLGWLALVVQPLHPAHRFGTGSRSIWMPPPDVVAYRRHGQRQVRQAFSPASPM